MGKLFQWTIKDIVEIIEGRINNRFDFILVIDGKRGLGKSSLAFKILSRVKCPILFKPKRDIVYDQKEVLRHLASKKGGCVLVDEAVNVIYNRDFYSEGQKTLLKQINMFRDANNIIIFCIPSFADTDVQLRELTSMRITILRRGVALVNIPKTSLFDKDIWSVKSNSVLEKKWEESSTKKPRYSQLSTAVGLLTFGDLTPQQREEYESIKQEKRNKVFGSYIDQSMTNDPDKLFYDKLIDLMRKRKITSQILETACVVNGKDYQTVRKKLNKILHDMGEENKVKDYVVYKQEKKKWCSK